MIDIEDVTTKVQVPTVVARLADHLNKNRSKVVHSSSTLGTLSPPGGRRRGRDPGTWPPVRTHAHQSASVGHA